ncbi:unnamed protein product, partial [Iphiclides podalirius]
MQSLFMVQGQPAGGGGAEGVAMCRNGINKSGQVACESHDCASLAPHASVPPSWTPLPPFLFPLRLPSTHAQDASRNVTKPLANFAPPQDTF